VRLDKSAILVRELAGQVGATAVVVNDSDSELLSVGEPSATMHCRSIRKPLIGALFGRPVIDGAIDLDATLADLAIDDNVPPPLTSSERAARVRDLLTCRSGVYHPSNHQTRSVTLPPRGTHQPGTHFLYNNWDFNALGTIGNGASRVSVCQSRAGHASSASSRPPACASRAYSVSWVAFGWPARPR
jgi:CubicO group peptidase (beta-lactamase class C family)